MIQQYFLKLSNSGEEKFSGSHCFHDWCRTGCSMPRIQYYNGAKNHGRQTLMFGCCCEELWKKDADMENK